MKTKASIVDPVAKTIALSVAVATLALATRGYAVIQVSGANTPSDQSVIADQEVAPTVSPETSRPEVNFSPAMKEILKLAHAKVSPEIIKAYIENYPYAYRPNANQIIAFTERGISPDIIETMVKHKDRVPPQMARLPQRQAPAQPQAAPAYSAAPNAAPPPQPSPAYDQPIASAAPSSSVYVIPYPTTYSSWGYNYSYPGLASYTYWPSYYYPYYGYYGYGYWPYRGYCGYYGHSHLGSHSCSYGHGGYGYRGYHANYGHPGYANRYAGYGSRYPYRAYGGTYNRGNYGNSNHGGRYPVYSGQRSPGFARTGSAGFTATAHSFPRPTMSTGFGGAARPAAFSGGQRFGGGGMRVGMGSAGGGGFRGGRR